MALGGVPCGFEWRLVLSRNQERREGEKCPLGLPTLPPAVIFDAIVLEPTNRVPDSPHASPRVQLDATLLPHLKNDCFEVGEMLPVATPISSNYMELFEIVGPIANRARKTHFNEDRAWVYEFHLCFGWC